ncbi:MAG: class I SAM-dependent methyltransferase [Hyphomonadaceae bacterium]
MNRLSRRFAIAGLAAVALAACEDRPRPPQGARRRRESTPEAGSLPWAIEGPWRLEPERDTWRHPLETLQFWGVQPNMTVLEILPGRGWYTCILAPFLARGGGTLIAAGFDPNTGSMAQRETQADFDARFLRDQNLYGRVVRTIVASDSAPIAPPASVDLAILTNSVHTLMAMGLAERVFRDIRAALKPNGVFGVEQHRASSTGLQDPLAGSGYVQEAYVKALAQEAGFEFVAATDVNANPRDDRDHPFGVWTLPPTLRTSALGLPDDPDFDSGPYAEIGESDRMTLKFRRPAEASAAPAAAAPAAPAPSP